MYTRFTVPCTRLRVIALIILTYPATLFRQDNPPTFASVALAGDIGRLFHSTRGDTLQAFDNWALRLLIRPGDFQGISPTGCGPEVGWLHPLDRKYAGTRPPF